MRRRRGQGRWWRNKIAIVAKRYEVAFLRKTIAIVKLTALVTACKSFRKPIPTTANYPTSIASLSGPKVTTAGGTFK